MTGQFHWWRQHSRRTTQDPARAHTHAHAVLAQVLMGTEVYYFSHADGCCNGDASQKKEKEKESQSLTLYKIAEIYSTYEQLLLKHFVKHNILNSLTRATSGNMQAHWVWKRATEAYVYTFIFVKRFVLVKVMMEWNLNMLRTPGTRQSIAEHRAWAHSWDNLVWFSEVEENQRTRKKPKPTRGEHVQLHTGRNQGSGSNQRP